ncbi:MAG: DUF2207 domain-containing protein [Chromatiales bacterium]|nr:DUF2207 domain-containing protein [Chromatiales bacterium]
MTRILRLLLTLAAAIACIPLGQAEEAILSFNSDIRINTDGSMLVEETIVVRAEGKEIKRGIYRDFPTQYHDRVGNRYKVGFELLAVLRDGHSEKHHTRNLDNGIRIYIGDKNVHLHKDIYTYTIRYTTDRQLGFFDQHDELYWNVTGNGWAFPIKKASASVWLPKQLDSNALSVEGYTGPQGAQGRHYEAWVEYDGTARFRTTQPLNRYEGLTLVTTWPKGLVIEPSATDRLGWILADNHETAVGAIGISILLIYYFLSWQRVGRDPDMGVVIPEYTPPNGFSPASLRFVQKMGYDKQSFSAALINMAVAGYLIIDEDKAGQFTLMRTGNNVELAPGERAIAESLFGSKRDTITLKKSNHRQLGEAIRAHEKSLKQDYEVIHFRTNKAYLVPGFLISAATMVLAVLNLESTDQRIVVGFMSVWLSGWSLGIFSLLKGILTSWRGYQVSGKGIGKVVAGIVGAAPFLLGAVAGIGMMVGIGGSIPLAICLLVLLMINVLFYEWMKAPTQLGQKLRTKTAGFSLYLEVAEKDELDFKHPPDKTPELFERYLPYAIALGVEHQWAEKFTSILANAQMADAYNPQWYHGDSWHPGNIQGFTSTVGSAMSSAVSSSSTAPGSSSGSGGGGSSGGGGGGGGGGGW